MSDNKVQWRDVVVRADVRTFNGNVFPAEVLKKAVEEAQEKVHSGLWFGGDGRYPVTMTDASHIVRELTFKNGTVEATIETLPTESGKLLATMLQLPSSDGISMRLYPEGLVRRRDAAPRLGDGQTLRDFTFLAIHADPKPIVQVREENAELTALFERQERRLGEARKLWCEEHNEPLTHPDLGQLIHWLIETRAAALKENADLKWFVESLKTGFIGELVSRRMLGHVARAVRGRVTADGWCDDAILDSIIEACEPVAEQRTMTRLFESWGTGPRTPSALYAENEKLKAQLRKQQEVVNAARDWNESGVDAGETARRELTLREAINDLETE